MSDECLTAIDERVGAIRRAFGPAIGARLSAYSTAVLLLDDGTWSAWPEFPIRLEWDSGRFVAVSWSKFDDSWIAVDSSVSWATVADPWIATHSSSPFSINGMTARWVREASNSVDLFVGAVLLSVALGRGQMSVAGREIEVWTRVLLETDRGWLEIFDALDENGYEFHAEPPTGALVPCI